MTKRGDIYYLYPVMLFRFVSVRELIRGHMYMYIYRIENRVHIVYAQLQIKIESNPYKQEGSDGIALIRLPVRAFSACMHN